MGNKHKDRPTWPVHTFSLSPPSSSLQRLPTLFSHLLWMPFPKPGTDAEHVGDFFNFLPSCLASLAGTREQGGGADGDGGEEMGEKTAGNGVVGGDGKQQAGAGMGSHTPGKAFLQEAENYFLFLHAMAGVGGNHPDQDSYCPPRLGQV